MRCFAHKLISIVSAVPLCVNVYVCCEHTNTRMLHVFDDHVRSSFCTVANCTQSTLFPSSIRDIRTHIQIHCFLSHTHLISLSHPPHTPHPNLPLTTSLSRTCDAPVHINAVGFMQQHFKDLLDNKKYVDVTFVVEGQLVSAHRLILASQSDYFDRLFYGKMKEANSSDEIPLPNVPLEAFRLLLEFMYSGCLDYDNQPLQVSVFCRVCGVTEREEGVLCHVCGVTGERRVCYVMCVE